jgi:hypothetical protein
MQFIILVNDELSPNLISAAPNTRDADNVDMSISWRSEQARE